MIPLDFCLPCCQSSLGRNRGLAAGVGSAAGVPDEPGRTVHPQYAQLVPVAPKATVTCRDADDQKFIDLAVAHKAMLLSKDNAVLCMSKRLLALGVIARVAM